LHQLNSVCRLFIDGARRQALHQRLHGLIEKLPGCGIARQLAVD
jgi:hypothetical protein